MLFKFNSTLIDKTPEAFEHISESYLNQFVSYIIHSDYRRATNLVRWIKTQLKDSETNEDALRSIKQIKTYQDYDKQVLAVLRWVQANFKYIGDTKVWKMAEYWQTFEESLSKRTGDCEDGAILMYILCRLKGVPENRLMIFAGNVVGGGHCWLGYRPQEYPLNWSFIDWCYWPTQLSMNRRPLFYINGKTIYGYKHNNGVQTGTYNNYQSIWFAFNELKGHRVLRYKRAR